MSAQKPASLSLELPGVDFQQMAREAIAGKLVEALTGADDVVGKIVVAAMSQKVSQHGTHSDYDYENKTPFIEWMAQDLIRGAALEALRTKVEAMKPVIVAAIEKQIKKDTKSIAKALAEGFVSNAKSAHTFSFKVEMKEHTK